MTSETKCWMCHRTEAEVLAEARKLNFEPVIELRQAIVKQEILGIKLPICSICIWAIKEVAIDWLVTELEADSLDEILTSKDLENMETKIILERR